MANQVTKKIVRLTATEIDEHIHEGDADFDMVIARAIRKKGEDPDRFRSADGTFDLQLGGPGQYIVTEILR